MAPAAAASPSVLGLRDPVYYGKCMIGGVLACGVTHAAVVSLDLAKCRAQAHSKSGLWPSGLIPGLKKIATEEGAAGLRVGWVPTLFGCVNVVCGHLPHAVYTHLYAVALVYLCSPHYS